MGIPQPRNICRFWAGFICALMIGLFQATAHAQTWATQTVDAQKLFREFAPRAIAIDAGGHPHIVYGQDHLYHVYHDGSVWRQEVVDNSPQVGEFAGIAIDTLNRIHVSYYDAANGDLKYATNRTGAWVSLTVDSDDDVGRYAAIALDGSNDAHISYYDATNDDLKYATNRFGAWTSVIVDSADDVGQYTSIALDGANDAHISYYDATHFDLKYATNASGGWVPETVDSGGNMGLYSSLAISGGSDAAHISYYDSTNRDLKYTTNGSGAWVSETVESGGNVGEFTSIALDGSDKVHISYYDSTGTALKYATNTPTNPGDPNVWVDTPLDTGGDVGKYSSIALHIPLAGGPVVHISYFNATLNELKYATPDGLGGCDLSTVDPVSYTHLTLPTIYSV